jgi:predicted restriction endonuclease
VLKDRRDLQERQVHKEHKEIRARKEKLVLKVLQELRVHKALQELLERKELLVLRELRDLQELKVK